MICDPGNKTNHISQFKTFDNIAMLESMTGYGRGEYDLENIRAVAEIRSVNYRYCEISLKLPFHLQVYETTLKEKIQNRVKRGKISLNVQLEHPVSEEEPIRIQEDLIKKRLETLEKIRQIAGIKEPLKLDHLLAFQELFETSEDDPEILNQQFKVVDEALSLAITQLLEMRHMEGRHLQKDLEERLATLKKYCDNVKENEKERISEVKLRMGERLAQLLDDNRISQDRLEQEIAIMADRLDISEELVRMDSHIAFFFECLNSDVSQGKKLNFLLQEMHREVNTIGSKANNSSITRQVVEMKEMIESIREQIQNVA